MLSDKELPSYLGPKPRAWPTPTRRVDGASVDRSVVDLALCNSHLPSRVCTLSPTTTAVPAEGTHGRGLPRAGGGDRDALGVRFAARPGSDPSKRPIRESRCR
jgi:hypothetical protein